MPDQIFTWNFGIAVIICIILICSTVEEVAKSKKCKCQKDKAE